MLCSGSEHPSLGQILLQAAGFGCTEIQRYSDGNGTNPAGVRQELFSPLLQES